MGLRTVCWKQGFLEFSLSSEDDAVLERAHEVFRFWQYSDKEDGGRPPAEMIMRVERCPDGFWFHPSQAPFSANPATPLPIEPIFCSTMESVMRAAETDSILAVFHHARNMLTVHGALLADGDDAVLIVGPSHSGKSTLSCALWASGWQLLADDVTILNGNGNTASPFLRRVSLRHPSRPLLGEEFWNRIVAAASCDATAEGYIFHPDEIERRARARAVRLRAIVFLKRLGAPELAPGQTREINPVNALISLAPYTNLIRQSDLGDTMRRLGPVINSVNSYDLARASLSEMVDKVRDIMEQKRADG